MGRKVDCEVSATQVELDGRWLDGVCVSCTRCEHYEEVAGESDRSVRRGLALLRENCPEGEDNYYVTDD